MIGTVTDVVPTVQQGHVQPDGAVDLVDDAGAGGEQAAADLGEREVADPGAARAVHRGRAGVAGDGDEAVRGARERDLRRHRGERCRPRRRWSRRG